jgi:hypothetical protein
MSDPLDTAGPLRSLVEGVGQIHLPRHTEQLRALGGGGES